MYDEPFLHPYNESYLVMIYDLSGFVLPVCQYITEDVCLYLIKDIDLWSSFLFGSFSDFEISVMLTSRNEFERTPSLSTLLNILKIFGIITSFIVL